MKSLAEILSPEVPLHTGCNAPKQPGDRVMIGPNRGPVFEVIHVAGATVWIRALADGQEGLVPMDRLRLVEAAGYTSGEVEPVGAP